MLSGQNRNKLKDNAINDEKLGHGKATEMHIRTLKYPKLAICCFPKMGVSDFCLERVSIMSGKRQGLEGRGSVIRLAIS